MKLDLDRIANAVAVAMLGFLVSLVVLALAVGAALPPSPAVPSKPAPPIVRRAAADMPPILADAFARLRDAERQRDPADPGDRVTWSHECCHGVSALADIANGPRHERHSIYIGEGLTVDFAHPKITIREIAAAIPADDRTGPYGTMAATYLVEQAAHWNDRPIYLVEEWVAYTHGAIYREQAGFEGRADTHWRAKAFERWIRVLARLARERDPGYPEIEKLEAFIEWNAARLPAGS
jgi:hypothetical protein